MVADEPKYTSMSTIESQDKRSATLAINCQNQVHLWDAFADAESPSLSIGCHNIGCYFPGDYTPSATNESIE